MSTYASTQAITTQAHKDRILVNGRDVTWFRDYRTPTPQYRLMEPFGYGSAALVFPQVHAVYENHLFGVAGELGWVKKGALVKVQRVDDTGAVVATDYRGVVMDIDIDGRVLSLTLGGILAGPASLRERQPPVYRRLKDIDEWAFEGVNREGMPPYVSFDAASGPGGSKRTGIEIVETGGQSQLDWLQELCTLSMRRDGTVKTIMPMVDGGRKFELRDKDITTVHYTLYLDGHRASAQLSNSGADHTNVYFATGTEPNGAYFDGSVFPLIETDEEPPAYPGTVLTEGSTGESVKQANWKLVRGPWLGRAETDAELDTYDEETTEAVEDFQKWAGLTVTGNINEATWDALWDVNVKSWGLSGSRIEPIAQADDVRPWNYSGNGALLGENPNFDAHKLRSDRSLDFGGNIKERTVRNWCKGMLARTDQDSYVGTIDLNGVGLIAGRHNYGDVMPTAADIVPIRSIRPGTNVWLPDLQGGTLVHIAEVDVQPGTDNSPPTARLTVDPHHRDAAELAEVIARRRDSKRSPRREWVHTFRNSRKVHDAVQPFHKKAGLNWRKVNCPANRWTGFWIFAGYAGTLSRFRIATTPFAETCGLVAAARISRKVLDRRIGNPRPLNAKGQSVWSQANVKDLIEDNFVIYTWGTEEQPGGYWPGEHTSRDRATTDDPLTGVWQDDASIGYATFDLPALWVAVYPDRDCVIDRGRLFRTQLDSGA